MTMNTALKTACDQVGGITALSKLLGISPPSVHQWFSGSRRVPVERCIQIESATHGAVRAEDLRPDVPWHVIRGKRGASA